MSTDSVVSRLYSSFSDLERAIEEARNTLEARELVPASIFERLDSYAEIISRQRSLAKELELHIASGDMEEVARHVRIINSLSGMIIEDAKQILGMLADETATEEEGEAEDVLC